VATALPFFPDFDPQRIVEGRGRGGPAGPGVRFNVELGPAFDPPVSDPVLGTPFALPIGGLSPTIDSARSASGPYSRMRFVRASDVADFPAPLEVPVHRGAHGALYQDLTGISLADDGPGNPAVVQLVPVDLYDNVTDPPVGRIIDLIASRGIRIIAPDLDGDPTRETIILDRADGIAVTIDDDGGANSGPPSAVLAVVELGSPTDSLAISLTSSTLGLPGAAGNPNGGRGSGR
jgi:hypothetical protein